MSDHTNSFSIKEKTYKYYDLKSLDSEKVDRLPFTHKILLENALRHAENDHEGPKDVETILNWNPKSDQSTEISFTPSRVILQDFTGVPAVVDLATMRDAVVSMQGDPKDINPLSPAELVIDHSVQVDHFGSLDALEKNNKVEFQRNQERYRFLRWGQDAFSNFEVVPPNTGIVHQVNLEYLGRVVFSKDDSLAYPDTLVGTDSHTTMINGIGCLGWGVGGIEAEAAMLGQPITMLLPEVIGVSVKGSLKEGVTATDLVLTLTEILRNYGVVGKFVEFFGDGLDHLPVSDRATLSNMAPEFGSTCAIFPIDAATIRYLKLSGRHEEQVELVETYSKIQGLWRESDSKITYTDVIELDLSEIEPCLSGPKRPQDRIKLKDVASVVKSEIGDESSSLDEISSGSVLIAAITSCTNTSNPTVMVAAGLVAKKANALGLKSKEWVKTSLAPGSKVVTKYLEKSGLLPELETMGFNIVGYGCTTCIGNSGPLDPAVAKRVQENNISASSVLSGNRNFEGRIHPLVKHNFLASPPLVVAYAIAGSTMLDLTNEPLGNVEGKDIFLKDIWPSQNEIEKIIEETIDPVMFSKAYEDSIQGDDAWKNLETPQGEIYEWQENSTYIKKPPYFESMSMDIPGIKTIQNARALALLGDSVTTDHISPAGNIDPESPAGRYLKDNGVERKDFNSYGSRRGNHEVMMRGTFANIRLRNKLAPGTEGGWTKLSENEEPISIFEAAEEFRSSDTDLIVLAGKEYGTGSSRDWAAKGVSLLGVKAVIAESYERIHRSNLIGMGVLPLEFNNGESAESIGLNGFESFDIESITRDSRVLSVKAKSIDGEVNTFEVKIRIDTPKEWEYFEHGGILHYVIRRLVAK
ncbi:MAG: aconitate hydratase AcnA [Proteobacteria bacterium]|jgi:aconitate hydratase|nr:aconitate hydratase AcnA [Pseudomonadota bacterium]